MAIGHLGSLWWPATRGGHGSRGEAASVDALAGKRRPASTSPKPFCCGSTPLVALGPLLASPCARHPHPPGGAGRRHPSGGGGAPHNYVCRRRAAAERHGPTVSLELP